MRYCEAKTCNFNKKDIIARYSQNCETKSELQDKNSELWGKNWELWGKNWELWGKNWELRDIM